MRINVSATLKKHAEDLAKPKPMPKVRVKGFAAIIQESIDNTPDPYQTGPITDRKSLHEEIKKSGINEFMVSMNSAIAKSNLISSLWNEYHAISTDQKKLCTQIAHLVRDGATQERLREQYERIEAYQPQLQAMRDKISYAEKHGELPPLPGDASEIDDINALKVKAKTLVEKRSKLKKKLALKTAKNPERFVHWEKELAMAEIEWMHVDGRINDLKGKTL